MIAKALVEILMNNPQITGEIADRLYPIIDIPEISSEELTAIYYSVIMRPVMTKNGPIANDHIVTVLTIASSYQKNWEISLKVRDALQFKQGTFKNVNFRLPECSEIADEYELTPGNMYGQKLTFNIRTAYY